jgi:hypothetical protein
METRVKGVVIRRDDHDGVDEVVIYRPRRFHLEMMDDDLVWVGLDHGDKDSGGDEEYSSFIHVAAVPPKRLRRVWDLICKAAIRFGYDPPCWGRAEVTVEVDV